MKKLLTLLLALTFVFTLTACGTSSDDQMMEGDDTMMEDGATDNGTMMEDEGMMEAQ